MAEKKVKKNEKKLAVCPRLCYTTRMKDKEYEVASYKGEYVDVLCEDEKNEMVLVRLRNGEEKLVSEFSVDFFLR